MFSQKDYIKEEEGCKPCGAQEMVVSVDLLFYPDFLLEICSCQHCKTNHVNALTPKV